MRAVAQIGRDTFLVLTREPNWPGHITRDSAAVAHRGASGRVVNVVQGKVSAQHSLPHLYRTHNWGELTDKRRGEEAVRLVLDHLATINARPALRLTDTSLKAVSAAERLGSAEPLAEFLREAGMIAAADALAQWKIVPRPAEPDDPDIALVAAMEHFREWFPPGHIRRLAKRHGKTAHDMRQWAEEMVAEEYGLPETKLRNALGGRSRSFKKRQKRSPRPE